VSTCHPFVFEAIGTHWEISTATPLPDDLRTAIRAQAEGFDHIWSRFRDDSLVRRIARAEHGGRFVFPDDSVALFDLYDRLAAATDGGVDPLVGRDLELLGYDATYTLRPDAAAIAARGTPEAWAWDVRRDGSAIETDRPVVIDVGAAGKGHLVDLLAQLLLNRGVVDFVVDGSGDMRHAGDEPLRVGLQHPTAPDRVLGVVELASRSLCASAVNRRVWGEGLHHVLDGRTRRPTTAVVATWVLADDTATADGLATALFVAAPSQLSSFEFTWVRMLADGRVQWSNDFAGELFV
jgi:thiamine biosynthesis lipoprotein